MRFYNTFIICFIFFVQLFCFNTCSDSGSKGELDAAQNIDVDNSLNRGAIDQSVNESEDTSVASDSTNLSSILADWFECLDYDCKELSFFGLRFNNNGTYTRVFSSTAQHQSGEDYCYLSRDTFISIFWWDGEKLTIMQPVTGQKYNLLWRINGDIADITYGEKSWKSRRIPAKNAKGPCKERSKLICPRLRLHSVDGICDWEWNCDQGNFTLTCTRQPGGKYICNCSKDDSTTIKEFDANNANICEKGVVKDPPTFARTNCNWNIWMPEMFDPPESGELL